MVKNIEQEITEIKARIEESFGFKVIQEWVPVQPFEHGINKAVLLVTCDLPKEIEGNYEKYRELEIDVYIKLRGYIEASPYFDMIAFI